jgi:RNA polymerase sigma-70 factor, ECF subfamily
MYWKSEPTYEDVAAIEYMDNLYRYAMVLTRNRSEAEDLVQETYVRAIRAMDSLRAGSNMKSWLYTILRNIWINQLRKQYTSLEMASAELDDVVMETSKDPHELYVSSLWREQLRQAIHQLPVDFREVIVLREYEELSYQEIARLVGCPVGTVMSRLARARIKLRALLSVTMQPPDAQSGFGGRRNTGMNALGKDCAE